MFKITPPILRISGLCVALLTAVAMQAATVSFTASDWATAQSLSDGATVTSYSKDGVTVTFAQGTAANAVTWNETQGTLAAVSGNTMKIAAPDGYVLEKAKITMNGTAQASNLAAATWSIGSASAYNTDVTWQGSGQSVSVTISNTARFKEFAITIEEAEEPEPPIVEDETKYNDTTVVSFPAWRENEGFEDYEQFQSTITYSSAGKKIVAVPGGECQFRGNVLYLEYRSTISFSAPYAMRKIRFSFTNTIYVNRFLNGNGDSWKAATCSAGSFSLDPTDPSGLTVRWLGNTNEVTMTMGDGEEFTSFMIICDKTDSKATVTFYGLKGEILKTEEVPFGSAATAPIIDHECFGGWSADFTNVHADLEVRALASVASSIEANKWQEYRSDSLSYSLNGYTVTASYVSRTTPNWYASCICFTPGDAFTVTHESAFKQLTLECRNVENATRLAESKCSTGAFVRDSNRVYWFGETNSLTITRPSKASGNFDIRSFGFPCEYYEKVPCTVIFLDANGEEYARRNVLKGDSLADVPAGPAALEACQRFVKWDTNLSKIMGDITVRPVYEAIQWLSLTAIEWNEQTNMQPITKDGFRLSTTGSYEASCLSLARNNTLTIQNPQYLYNLTITCSSANDAESIAGSTWSAGQAVAEDKIVKWTGATDSLVMTRTNKVGSTRVKISSIVSECQELDSATVTFYDFFGNVLKVEKVANGGAATAPSFTSDCFAGWDADFSAVYADLDVHPKAIVLFSLTAEEWKKQSGKYDELQTITKAGYTMVGGAMCNEWEGQYYVNYYGTASQTIIGQQPFNNLTIETNGQNDATHLANAIWSNGEAVADGEYVHWYGYTDTLTFQMTQTNAGVKSFLIECKTISHYTVIFYDAAGAELTRVTVPAGQSALAPTAPELTGYTFVGWDTDLTSIGGDIPFIYVHPIYAEAEGYVNVIFVDIVGNELQKTRIPIGSSVTAPEAPTLKYHTFRGWDHALTGFTENTVIKPMYEFDLNSPDIMTVKQFNQYKEDERWNWEKEHPECAIRGLYHDLGKNVEDGKLTFALRATGESWSEATTVYHMLYLNQEPFLSHLDIAEGDTLIVYGTCEPDTVMVIINPYTGPEYITEEAGLKHGYVVWVGAKAGEKDIVNINMPDAATLYDFSGNGLKQAVYYADKSSLLTGDITNNFRMERSLGAVDAKALFIEDVNHDGRPDVGYEYFNSLLSNGDSYDLMEGALFLPNFDANGDGRMDYMLPASNDIMYQMADGSFRKEHMLIYSYDDYMAQFDEAEWAETYKEETYSSSTGLVANSGWSCGMVFSGACLARSPRRYPNDKRAPSIGYTVGSVTRALDLNADGFIDLVDEKNGYLYQNMGNNKWIRFYIGRIIQPADLDNDGFTDYIFPGAELYVMIYKGDGKFDYRSIYNNAAVDDLLYCYDFDHDGDIDILATFSTKHNATNRAYTCFFLNDGQGNFTRQTEQMYGTENLWFSACQDIDGDGYFDLLSFRGNIDDRAQFAYQSDIEIVWLKGKADMSFEDPQLLYTIVKPMENYGSVQLAGKRINAEDLDNDGKAEIWVSGLTEGTTRLYSMANATANTAPTAPAKPTLLYDNGRMTVSWGNGSDALTRTGDLTYALRIGTTAGGNEILAAHANTNGSRQDFLDGSMGRNHTYTIDLRMYAPATLYVAVQAIDAQHVGSAWSQEATVEHTYIPAEFELSSKITPFNEAVEVHYTELPAGYSHAWDWAGGTLVGNMLFYTTAGEKVITHTVAAPNGKAASYSVTLTVLPNGINPEGLSGDLSYFLLGGWDYNANAFTDFNRDGNMDVLLDNVVYTGATPLAYTQATGLWNTQLSANNFYWLDWNKNGSADLLLINENGSKYLPHQDNAPDMAADEVADATIDYFANSKYDSEHFGYLTLQADFLHIGQLTTYKYKTGTGEPCYFLIPNGDTYRQVEVVTNGDLELLKRALQSSAVQDNGGFFYATMTDYNRDGWMDVAILFDEFADGVQQYRRLFIFENQGNAQFTQIDVPFTQSISVDDLSNAQLVDLNGDGTIDIIAQKSDYRNIYNSRKYILWNNANSSFSAPEVLYTGEISSSNRFMDVNNDGYIDIVTRRQNKAAGESVYGWYVWYMGPQGIVRQGFMAYTPQYVYNWYSVLPNRLFIEDQQYIPAVYNEDGSLVSSEKTVNVIMEVESAEPNVAPQAPDQLRAVATTEGILIEWNDAADDHTPANKMRYNLSVKKAGQIGAGSYIVSPQNGGNAQTAYLPSYRYMEATRYLVSKDALTAGDYEISVQAIDQRNLMSAFSNGVTIHFDRPAIEAPTTICAGEPATIVYMGGETGTPTWNFDGGVVSGGTALGTQYVTWSTPGMKTITLTLNGKTYSHMIYVDDNNANVALPGKLFDGGEVAVELPANMTAEWSIEIGNTTTTTATLTPNGINGQDKQLTVKDGVLTLDTKKAFATPLTRFSTIYLHLTLTNASGCEATFSQRIEIIEASAYPQISLVTTNADGHYVINWDNSVAGVFTNVIVLKETNRLDQFVELGIVDAATGSYVDRSSDASQKAERYAVRGVISGGGMSPVSPVHQSVHMTINRGMNDQTWNLIWNQYDGADVVSYNILRGSSENTLAQIASVSAVNTSYTDVALDAQPYYAIEFVLREPASASPMKRMLLANPSGRSNIVNSNAARTVTYAQSMTIQSANGSYETTAEKPMLLLYAEVLPTNTTYKNVVWEITSGNTLATIDRSSGLITANNPNSGGVITVKATTIDGTNVTATRQITIAKMEQSTDPQPVYYTIRFVNWDGTVLQSSQVLKGDMPTYNGATPTRPDDEQFIYTFTGWAPTITAAASDATYTATYSAQQKPQGLEDVQSDDVQGTKVRKIMMDGVLYILRDGKIFTVTGQEVR